MLKISNPFPMFFDLHQLPLEEGKIYVGEAGADPEVVPVDCFWDFARTIPAAQPLRTISGQIVNDATPAEVFINEDDCSLRVRDSNDVEVQPYSAAFLAAGAAYQLLDDDLTAISEQDNTAYGIALLASVTPTEGPGIALTTDVDGVVTEIAIDPASAADMRSGAADKVLTPDAVFDAAAAVALTDAATVEIDMSAGLNFTLGINGNRTLDNPTGAKPGQSGRIAITQGAGGSHALIYGTDWEFAGGSAPTLSTAAGAKDLLYFDVLAAGSVFANLVKDVK